MGSVAYFDKHSVRIKVCKIAYNENVEDNINYCNLQINNKLDNHCLITGSVASPVCQEGQSERTVPIFAFSSRFFLFVSRFFLIFSLFFPIVGKFLAVRGGTLPPLTQVATPLLITFDCALNGLCNPITPLLLGA